MTNGLEEISLPKFNAYKWLIWECKTLSNSCNHDFKTNNQVVDLLCFVMIEIAHCLQYIEKEWLPIWEKDDALHTDEFEKWFKWL